MASGTLGGTLRHLRDLFHDGTAAGLGDGQLLARFAAERDESAFEALVARHGPMVLATCRAVLKHEQDVEDAFQATFLVFARKARSVRAGDALGGWLHRVAYRVAVQAGAEVRRRRRREAEAAMMTLSLSQAGPEPDLASIVHEELDRLPDRHRLPVVLCDLEGLTNAQAAGRLHWTEPTLRHRLLQARRRLRERLIRRGITAGAVGVVLASATAGARAAVPAALARSAVAAAAGGTISATAAALSADLIRSLFLTKLRIAFAGLAAVAAAVLATAGAAAVGSGRPDPSPAAMPSQAGGQMKRPPAAKDATTPAPASAEVIEVHGRVVDEFGRPVAGAAVRVVHRVGFTEPAPETTSGPSGRFTLRIPPPWSRKIPGRTPDAPYPWVVASAPAFGPGWASAVRPPGGPGETTIELVEDQVIVGRIVNLEGRPVVNARIGVDSIWFSREGGLAAWLDRVRDRDIEYPVDNLDSLPAPSDLHTDHEGRSRLMGIVRLFVPGPTIATPRPSELYTDGAGRFRLTGIGRDRIVRLFVSGPKIATTRLHATTRDGAAVHITDSHRVAPDESRITVHPRLFECAVAPSRPIEGVIRDKDTGRPLAGLDLWATIMIQGELVPVFIHAKAITTKTDAQGRYRLTGLPIATSYHFQVTPGPGQPYTAGTFHTPVVRTSLEPVRFDVALKRGIVVRGRMTDKATGRPVLGAVAAYTFADNPHVREFPGYDETYQVRAIKAEDDGRYEIVTPPGRGIIAGNAGDPYRHGIGAEAIAGYDFRPDRETAGSFHTLPQACNAASYHVLAGVNLDPGVESVTLDLQVDPGRSLTLHVVDPQDQPLVGTIASNVFDLSQVSVQVHESAEIAVHALDPSRPRRVIVRHDGRKLIGSVDLKGDETGSRTVKLEPWGAVIGRVVDAEGRPVAGVPLYNLGNIYRKPPAGRGLLPASTYGPAFHTGADGRFRIEGLVPGLEYGATEKFQDPSSGVFFRDVTVVPGEVRDLGDLKVIPPGRDD